MDIPLPDEDPPIKEIVDESLADIPVPEDTNRYSPSLPIEDDPTDFKNDVAAISLPSASQKLPVPPTVSVLGKEAAKKRLLAFSQAKQSFISQKRKPSVQAVLEGNVLKENDAKSIQPKKKKKGVLDKARDTISEIEELKRRENEVMETMQVLFPMWSNLDKKTTVTSQINQDGIVEKSDRIESVVEKLLSKKIKHERKEQERLERLEERKRKRERREKEIRRLMPKSWSEFTKSGFKAYHFRRQKFRLEKLSGGKERTRSHEHEREGSKRINLLDTPMVLKKSFVVCGLNGEDVEFPCWAVRYTNTWPQLTYCLNPKYDTKCLISRKEMLSTLPEDIYLIVKKFLSSTSLNKFNEVKPESSRPWWKRDSFLIPKSPGNNLVEPRSDMETNDNARDTFHGNLLVSNSNLYDSSDYIKVSKNEEFDKSSSRSVSGSVVPSSEGPTSDVEKSYSSEMSEVEVLTVNKTSTDKEDSKNKENLASEYEQFIKTIGPNTDNKEVSKRTGRADEIWSDVSEKKEISGSSAATTKKKLGVEDRKKSRDKKLQKDKRKKIKNKTKKRSHSSDSSSSETSSTSSRSSSSSSDSSSTTSTSSSSSSSGDSSSSSSSSSTSSSNDSSSESSSSTSSSGSTTSSDSQSFDGKSKKKLRRKRLSKKKIISGRKSKNKKFAKLENEDEKAFIKKKKKNDDLDKDDKENMVNKAKSCDLNNAIGSSEKSFSELTEGPEESLIDKSEVRAPSGIIAEEKVSQDEIYEPRDSSPQSRTSDETGSSLSNSSLKSITSEPILSNEQKDTNNSLHWNSGEESVSNLTTGQDAHENCLDKPPEGKRHFNIDMFQESHNCTPEMTDTRQSPVENMSHTDSKEELKEEEHDNTCSRVLPQPEEESALKSLERYSPTAEDDDEECEDILTNTASGGGSTVDEASSQLVSFGVNSASEEARMLDIPLPPPIEPPSEAPTSFRNILQLPSSPNQQSHQLDLKKKNIVLVGKSPVARLTFGKQVMKLKPISIFSTEDSDSEADKTSFPPSAVSETNEASILSSSGALEAKEDNFTQESANSSQITNEIIINQASVSELDDGNTNAKPANVVLDSSSPQSKKSRWDQEALKNEERDCIGDVAERSLLINPPSEMVNNSERNVSGFQPVLSVPELLEKVKGKIKKEDSRSPIPNDRKRRRERSHSSERDRRRRERGWSPRDRGRFSRGRRRDFRKRSHSKERRSRRDSPHREFSPSWRKGSPQSKTLRRSPSTEGEQRKMFEKSLRTENIGTNHEVTIEPSLTFDSSWNKSELNSNDIIKDSYNSSPKRKESLSDWDSPERKYSPSSRKESPKRKKSPIPRDSPFRSPRRKESPMRKRSPENRKESPSRRYSPRRSPLPWKRSSPDRRRSPYSPRRSPMRRRASPDRKRPSSPYRRRSPSSPERKYSGRYIRKSPIKPPAYSDSPSREENWKWEEDKGAEAEHFPKWDYEAAQGDAGSDYQTSLADSTISDSELVKEPPSPKRMSLDERLKIELGHSNTNIEPEQAQNPMPSFPNLYYPPPAVPDQVGYFPHQQFNVNHQPPPRPPLGWNPSLHPPQLPNKLVQVGNVLQVVPTEIPVEPVFSAPPPKIVRNVEAIRPKVLQVGNVLQVVPSQEPPPPAGLLPPQFNASIAPPAPVAAPLPKVTPPPPQPPPPVSIISLPFPPGTGSPNVFLKMEEKERRRKEKELRKEKKEQKVARRMLRKAMLKKKLAKANEPDNEANTCGAQVGDNESGELNPSKAALVLPSPDKGILIGLKDTVVLTSTKKKSVSFADGIKPGEGTSPSGGEEHPLSPPPLIRKPVKKRKKRKVKVRIIRIDSNAKEEESEEDELSPPPPPPGTPPPEAYIEYTASGRYLYPVSASQPFPGNQDSGTVFPPLPAVNASPAAVVQFATPPLPQPR